MKTTFTLALSLFAVFVFAQIPNASFENWSNNAPVGWSTNNNVASGLVTENSDAYQGHEAVGLNVVGTNGGSISASFPLTSVPDTLYGWYLGNFLNGDVLQVNCTVNNSGASTIASGTTSVNGGAGGAAVIYTRFAVQLTASGSLTATDSGYITVKLYNSTGSVNSQTSAIVDDLYFGPDLLLTGVENINQNVALMSCMPNPASNTANIIFSLKNSCTISVALYDVTGKLVKTIIDNTEMNAGEYKAPVDVTSLPAGVYFYTLTADGQRGTQKMIVAK